MLLVLKTEKVFIFGFLIVLSVVALDLPTGKGLVLSGFRTQGYRQDGSIEWELRGEEAVVSGAVAELQEAELIFFPDNGADVNITTAHCEFDQKTGEGQSEAPIEAKSGGMQLSGVGYDFVTEKQLLRIRSNVFMKISKSSAFPEEGESAEQ